MYQKVSGVFTYHDVRKIVSLLERHELFVAVVVTLFVIVAVLAVLLVRCCSPRRQERTNTTCSWMRRCCCCCCGGSEEPVREFDTLEDLLLEVDEHETARVEGEDLEASLDTIFPNLLENADKKKNNKPEESIQAQPQEQSDALEEPLL